MSFLRNIKQVSSAGIEPLIGTFGETLTGSKHDDVSVNFVYPFYNTDFDMEPAVLSGDGAVSVADSELVVSSASAGSSFAASKDKVRYREGHTGYADFTARFGTVGVAEAGCIDSEDGYAIRSTAGVMSVFRRRGGVDYDVITQANWNGDDLSDVDFTKKNIFRIMFGYLGVASPIFMIYKDRWRVMNIIKTEGIITDTTVTNPNFPISVKAVNGGFCSTSSWGAGVINGEQQSAGTRSFCEAISKTLSGTAVATMGSYYNKPTYKGKANKVRMQLLRYQFAVDAPASGYGTVEFTIYKNAILAGVVTLTDVDADNSIAQVDAVRTYSSGGKRIYIEQAQYSSATGQGSKTGGTSQLEATRLGLYLYPGETATITAQNVSGNTNVVCRAIFNHTELW